MLLWVADGSKRSGMDSNTTTRPAHSTDGLKASLEWLKVLLALLAAVLLAVVFLAVPVDNQSAMGTAGDGSHSSGIVVLVAVPIIYFLLRRGRHVATTTGSII
jgi:hypothetical protein